MVHTHGVGEEPSEGARENAPTGRSTLRHISVTGFGRSKAGSPLVAWEWLPLVGDCSLDGLIGPRGDPGKLRPPLAMMAMSEFKLQSRCAMV
ncbi:hypothetical protein VTN00DRAFT_1790 [Thermoascus crustaceus]|uniref:uncharacterized protein n=1 Tax=Thermoascus crustaceus TaxID=5088 RepID=UPI0037437E2F